VATIAERFKILDSLRTSKLERARYCSSLTIPSILPPLGWNEQMQLTQPYSSVSARGVTAMASRMLSALLPLNDMPFFKFELSSGVEPEADVNSYLENLSQQVYSRLSSGNLRETIYQALQHLIVIGDVLIIMEDDMSFRIVRLDRFVCLRDVYGEMEELLYVEYELLPQSEIINNEDITTSTLAMEDKAGYRAIYNKIVMEDDVWKVTKEDEDGGFIEGGEYTVSPFIMLSWSKIPGENYGRSHCEDMIGDIKTLEGFTEGLIGGIAASSIFWMGVDPTGITEIDDIAGSGNGTFVASRPNEVYTISPATTMTPQIQATQAGVEILRKEIGRGFLMDSASIPSGERVTATAVRMIGQELEHVLGGAFSAIARDLMEPVVKRTVFIMTANGDIDERLKEMFTEEEGLLSVEIITGLQALSRDSDLQKLMQMGEMVRNLPEQAAGMFRWDQYGMALITALGFNAEQWVKKEEQVRAEQMEMAQAQATMQGATNQQAMADQTVSQGISELASKDIAETGGQGIQQAINQMQGAV
jgi:hypothetical protein